MLLHSLLADRSVFDRAVPLLAPGRRVILPDLPGFGGSSSAGATIAGIADRTAELFDALDLDDDVDVLGNGFGGFVASTIAIRHGRRFDRLVLVGTGLGFSEQGRAAFHAMAARVRGAAHGRRRRHRDDAAFSAEFHRRQSCDRRRDLRISRRTAASGPHRRVKLDPRPRPVTFRADALTRQPTASSVFRRLLARTLAEDAREMAWADEAHLEGDQVDREIRLREKPPGCFDAPRGDELQRR